MQDNIEIAESEQVEVKQCLNCGAELDEDDAFCSSCGQRTSTGRLKTKGFLRNLIFDMSRLNKGALHTAFNLLWRPWIVAKEYVDGRRAKWTGPVQMLIILAFVNIAIDSIFHVSDSGVEVIAGEDDDFALGALVIKVVNFLEQSPVLFYMLLFLPFAPVIRWTTRKNHGESKLNLAEAIVYALYIGDSLLVLDIFNPNSAIEMLYFVVMATISVWMLQQNAAISNWRKAVRVLGFWVIIGLGYLGLIILIGILMVLASNVS